MSKFYLIPVQTWQIVQLAKDAKKTESGLLMKKWTAGIEFNNLQNSTKRLLKLIHHVEFKLHHSFDEPLKTVKNPRSDGKYSIDEEGYGTFPIIEKGYKNK